MNKKTGLRALPWMVFAILATASPAFANANLITYQGVLADAGGPLNGNADMNFTLWDADTGGTMVWGPEAHNAVPVVDGVFSTLLGSSAAFGAIFASNNLLWLEVSADVGAGTQVFGPRVPFTAAPFTFQAANAASADSADWTGIANVPADLADGDDIDGGDADTVDGQDAADFAPVVHTHPGTDVTSSVANADAAAAVPWTGLTGIPLDFADNTDDVDGGAAASVPWAGITGVPAGFADGIDDVDGGAAASAPWAGLTGVPAGFADNTDDVDGGNADLLDGIDSTGFAPSAHTHSGAAITSGTVDVAHLPVGTGATQVAAGNHAHSSLNASDGTPANALVVDADGDVGIGTASAGQRLEINGAMQFTGNGAVANQTTGVISKAVRVIHTVDPRSGCPPVQPAGTAFWNVPVTLARPATVFIIGNIIRKATGRKDLLLYVDGNRVNQWITNTGATYDWQNGEVQWSGVLGAGTHNIDMRGADADVWGCGGDWGSIDVIIYE